jgi:predicted DsbA family dithiol-disulfide isomerase
MAQLYPTVPMKDIREYMERFAASFGVHDMRPPDRLPNTRRALAVAEFARDSGKLDVFRDLAMQAHWEAGRDLENDRDLGELAAMAGLDPTAAIEAAGSDKYLRRVDDLREEACGMGITGIPTFIMRNQRVVGCQPYEVLADAARNAGALPK